MGMITLVPLSLAREGAIFRYAGMADECHDCSLKDICHRLKSGYRYRVTTVRDVTHPCAVHMEDTARVVEVEELPIIASISQRKAFESAIVKLDEGDCPLVRCENHYICTIPDDIKGGKVRVIEVRESMDCPRGLKLKKSIIEPDNQ